MRKVVILFVIFITIQSLSAQSYRVYGKITGTDDGKPIPFAIILIAGTTSGTIADSTGSYSIEIPSNTSTLVFSYIGYKTQEITIGENHEIDVNLESDIQEIGSFLIYSKKIDFALKSNIFYTPYGIEIGHFRPYLFNKSAMLSAKIGYQTNLVENNILSLKVHKNNFMERSKFRLNADVEYNNYKIAIDSLMKLNEIKSSISVYLIELLISTSIGAGYHHINYQDYNSTWGFLLGFDYSFRKSDVEFGFEIGNWFEYWDLKGHISCHIPKTKFTLGLSYYRILDYYDYSLKLNYRFTYY